MIGNLYLDAEARLNKTKELIRELEDAKKEIDRRIGEAERCVHVLKEKMKSAEGYESWLTSQGIRFTRFVTTDDGVIWWLLNVDGTTGALALIEGRHASRTPHVPCLCCHEQMLFSPYGLRGVENEEKFKGPDKGFRKDWSDPLLLACKSLGCTRLEVMGLDNAQRAQRVTPLPIEWCGESEGLRELILPPLYRS